jgi:hypothetical protein
MEGEPSKESKDKIRITNEQLLQQSKREFINKDISVEGIQEFAEQEDIIRSLIIERGIDIDQKLFEKILLVVPMIEPTRTSLLVCCVDGTALQFLRTDEGKMVRQLPFISEGGDRWRVVLSEALVIAQGEGADLLWDQYKPEVLNTLREDAQKIMGIKEDQQS